MVDMLLLNTVENTILIVFSLRKKNAAFYGLKELERQNLQIFVYCYKISKLNKNILILYTLEFEFKTRPCDFSRFNFVFMRDGFIF